MGVDDGRLRQRDPEARIAKQRRRSDQTRSSCHGKPLENGSGFRVCSLTNRAQKRDWLVQGLHPAEQWTPTELVRQRRLLRVQRRMRTGRGRWTVRVRGRTWLGKQGGYKSRSEVAGSGLAKKREKERGREALRKQILVAAIEHQNLQGGPNICSCSLQELFGS